MKPSRSQQGVFPQLERTDTLTMPALDDTARFAIPAIPVDAVDLAATLREQERLLQLSAHRVAELESGLAAAQQRCAELQRECDLLRQQAAPPSAAEVESAAVARLSAQLAQLQRQNERLHEALGTVQGQLAVREAMLAEAEEAARTAAPAAVVVPDDEDWRQRCAELSAALESERAQALDRAQQQEGRLAALEVELDAVRVRLQAQQALATEESSGRTAQPRPVGSVLRALVRDEGGAQVVYPLGRHTTIGRTPDNDIQVNASYVSRNHAVLLAGTDHCIIEDLNSTNGLLVNGRRVTREVLHDGDTVTIGKTHFRYQQRT
jgi:hypothetical protein